MDGMTTLKQAQQSGDLSAFIAEHKDQAPGDAAALDAVIESAAKTPLKAQKASRRGKPILGIHCTIPT
jgi:hypothetical protein